MENKTKRGHVKDYSPVYERILDIEPELEDYVRKAQQASKAYKGEKMNLLYSYVNGDVSKEEDLFDCFLPNLLSESLKAFERMEGDLQEIVQSKALCLLDGFRQSVGNKEKSHYIIFSMSKADKEDWDNPHVRARFEKYLKQHNCPACNADRYCKETLNWIRKNCMKCQSEVGIKSPKGAWIASMLQSVPLEWAAEYTNECSCETALFAIDLHDLLTDRLSTLTPREEKILSMRFGLDDGVEKTLEEVGKEFNVSRDRVRQIEAKALRKMRHPSRCRCLRDYY